MFLKILGRQLWIQGLYHYVFDKCVSYFTRTQLVCVHLSSKATQREQHTDSSNLTSTSQLRHVAECQKVAARAGNCRFKQMILIRTCPGSHWAKPPLVCQIWFIRPGGMNSAGYEDDHLQHRGEQSWEWEKKGVDKEENNHFALLSRIQYWTFLLSFVLTETQQTYSTPWNTDSYCAINAQYHRVKQVDQMLTIILQFLLYLQSVIWLHLDVLGILCIPV